MEYISKQSLLADLNEATPRSYFAFETMVREYPTEDVVPVVHAHWRENLTCDTYQTNLECSYCQYDFDIDNDILDMFKYCPHCGAKMDEEVDNA